MRDNIAELNGYDAIFAVENTVAALRRLGVAHPRLIYSPHGFGDRARGFIPRVATFDLVLLAGPKTAARMLEAGLVREGGYALTGSVKLDTAEHIARTTALPFARTQTTVLYNAHKEPKLTSWHRFVEPMLAGFAQDPSMNLIVAPHVKLFRRRREALRGRWRARSTANVLVDPGSDRSVDMSYAAASDIYVGDVSSQVYEFLANPRPCVFLNAHGIDWRDDPSFAHWHLGDVVDDPADLMAAIRAAPERHSLYRARQEAMARASLGPRPSSPIWRARPGHEDRLSLQSRRASSDPPHSAGDRRGRALSSGGGGGAHLLCRAGTRSSCTSGCCGGQGEVRFPEDRESRRGAGPRLALRRTISPHRHAAREPSGFCRARRAGGARNHLASAT